MYTCAQKWAFSVDSFFIQMKVMFPRAFIVNHYRINVLAYSIDVSNLFSWNGTDYTL